MIDAPSLISLFKERSATDLEYVKWNTISTLWKDRTETKEIVHINPEFSPSYADELVNVCVSHTKDSDTLFATIKPNGTLVFFE